MPKQLRYTSFKPGELEQRLREFAPQASISIPLTTSRDSGPLQKSHTFTVLFPDGKSGTCRYERKGPRDHRFYYTYWDGTSLPYQTYWERLGNDTLALEQKGGELSVRCYQEAIRREREHYFRRASEPLDGSRKRNPERYAMKVERAKEFAGWYAVCQRLNRQFLPTGKLYEDIEKANAAWREQGNICLVVACCNRLDRCWELPKYNTLYAEFDPREERAP